MADKLVLKMFFIIFISLFASNISSGLAAKQEKCSCYNVCNKNFTSNSIIDVQKITACQRGCRFYSLVLHTSRESNHAESLKNAKEGCLLSCAEVYLSPVEKSACDFGCTAVEMSKILCNSVEIQPPQISYSLLIEESDILIHPGEPEPDDSLTDPGLRKQIQKTLAALLDATPKIPEIRFRNLPVKTEKLTELSPTSFKCPKFYGLDSNFEFRNGKMIIGDLYVFGGVLIFIVLSFLLSHHWESDNIKRRFLNSRIFKEDSKLDEEPLIKVEIQPNDEEKEIENENEIEYEIENEIEYEIENEIVYEIENEKAENLVPENDLPDEFEGITLIFHEGEFPQESKPENSPTV